MTGKRWALTDHFYLNRDNQRILVLGGRTGLLGQALVHALRSRGCTKIHVQGRSDVDVLDFRSLQDYLQALGPGLIFNAVAHTRVDQAEQEPGLAFQLNQELVRVLAGFCREQGAFLVHFSTDFVFSGAKGTPYTPEDPPEPLSVYGRSKLAGEREILGSGLEDFLIIRTSWLFGPGRVNFVSRMLDLAQDQEVLRVVHDQIGSPTYTLDLAGNCLALLGKGARGVFHLANRGQATWCELAAEALKITGHSNQVLPIASADYPQAARRPGYSVLDLSAFVELTGLEPRPWPQALRDYLFGSGLCAG